VDWFPDERNLAVADLCNGGSESGDDDNIVVVLSKDCRFSAHSWRTGGNGGGYGGGGGGRRVRGQR